MADFVSEAGENSQIKVKTPDFFSDISGRNTLFPLS